MVCLCRLYFFFHRIENIIDSINTELVGCIFLTNTLWRDWKTFKIESNLHLHDIILNLKNHSHPYFFLILLTLNSRNKSIFLM